MTSSEIQNYVSTPQDSSESENHRVSVTSKNRRVWFIVVGSILIIGTCLPIIYFWFSSKASSEDNNRKKIFDAKYNEIRERIKRLGEETVPTICATEECYYSATALLSSMNLTMDPCDDFYNFVCAQWSSNFKPSRREIITHRKAIFDEIIDEKTIEILKETGSSNDPRSLKTAREYYKSCIDLEKRERDGIFPMIDILENYGGWPLVHRHWSSRRFNLIKSIVALHRKFSSKEIFEIRINQNSGKNTIEILPPSPFLVVDFLPTLSRQRDALIYLYKERITFIAKQVTSSYASVNKVPSKSMLSQINEIFQFSSKMFDIHNLISKKEHYATLELSLNQLDAYFSLEEPMYSAHGLRHHHVGVSLSLYQFLNQLFRYSGVSISNSTVVTVRDVDYVRAILKLLREAPKKTLANYLHMHMVDFMAHSTTQSMRYTNNYTLSILGINATETFGDRERSCASSTKTFFGLAVGHKLIENGVLSMETKTEIYKFSNDILSTYREILATTKDWMTDEVHFQMVNKLDKLQVCIGFPDWIKNATAIDIYYHKEGLFQIEADMHKESQYLKKYMKIKEWQGNQKFKKFTATGKNYCFDDLEGTYYDTEKNIIALPQSELQFPIFEQNGPRSVNFGDIGTTLGHELTHSYFYTDTSDILFSWKEYDYFKEAEECLVEHYDMEPWNGLEKNNSAQFTFDEDFADAGALVVAYYSLLRHLSKTGVEEKLPGLEEYDSEQLFYISYVFPYCSPYPDHIYRLIFQLLGDVDYHNPPSRRIIGALKNSREFARAWKCPLGSNMNTHSTPKCNVF